LVVFKPGTVCIWLSLQRLKTPRCIGLFPFRGKIQATFERAVVVFQAKNRRRQARRKGSCMNIYIGNLPFQISENSLKALFTEFGEVESVKVIKDRFSGRPKGYGFIEMPSNSEADQAIKALNGNRIEGNHIKVRPADPGGKRRKRRSNRRRRY
jgi:RNA recognition motif-containing protein